MFGVWHTTFFGSNLSLVLAFFGFVVFFVRALPFFFVFLFVWCFCYGFWFVSCQFLSSSWDCLSLIALSWCCFFYFVSWLLVCVWVGFWAAFWRELSGGSYGYGQPGGVNIFFGFSHSRGVWVKTAAALGEECFFKVAFFEKPASKRWKRTPVFNFVAGNAIKIGVPVIFCRNIKDPRLLTFLVFYLYFPDSKLYDCTLFGVFTKGLLNVKNATKIGVSGAVRGTFAGPKTGEIDAFKNGVPRSVREWGAYVARHEHPVFERIGWQTAGLVFKSQFGSDEEVSPGENTFFFVWKWLHQ